MPFRIGQRDALGHELADDQRQDGDADDHHGDRDLVSASRQYRDRVEDAAEPQRQASRRRYAPDRMPISVMPTCTPDRNRPGFSASFSARAAPREPSSAICWRRRRRDDTTAISASAKKPFSRMRPTTMASSSQTRHDRDVLARPASSSQLRIRNARKAVDGSAAARANSRQNKGGTPNIGEMTGKRPC